jgi:fibronectin-binding autotransporter adhesin
VTLLADTTYGGSGALNASGNISGSGFALTVANSNSVALGGNNTYTGATIVMGRLFVNSIRDGGLTSSLGASSNEGANLVLDGGSLIYSGLIASSDRLFTITSRGGSIDSRTYGSLNFTNTGSLIFSGTGSRTLSLLASIPGAGPGSIASIISDALSGAVSIVDGSGVWTLSGASTYSGTTTVSSGAILKAGSNSVIASGSIVSSPFGVSIITVNSGATLDLNSKTVSNALILSGVGVGGLGVLTDSAGSGVASGAIELTDNTTIGGANNFTIGGGVMSGAGKSLTKVGAGTVTLSGANTYSGVTTINGGSLRVSSLANGGSASNIGQSSNAASNLVLYRCGCQYRSIAHNHQ